MLQSLHPEDGWLVWIVSSAKNQRERVVINFIACYVQVNKSLRIREWVSELDLLQDLALTVQWRITRCGNRAVDIEAVHARRDGHQRGNYGFPERCHVCCHAQVWLAQPCGSSSNDRIGYGLEKWLRILGIETTVHRETTGISQRQV